MTARPSDRFIPWYFVLFFIGLALLLFWFVQLARSTHPGLVTDKAYDKGLKYNTVIARMEAQKKLGWAGTVETGLIEGKARVTLKLKDSDGAAVTDAKVTVWFVRPVQSGIDMKLQMEEREAGVYMVEARLPAPGVWDIDIGVAKGEARYQVSKRAEFRL